MIWHIAPPDDHKVSLDNEETFRIHLHLNFSGKFIQKKLMDLRFAWKNTENSVLVLSLPENKRINWKSRFVWNLVFEYLKIISFALCGTAVFDDIMWHGRVSRLSKFSNNNMMLFTKTVKHRFPISFANIDFIHKIWVVYVGGFSRPQLSKKKSRVV